MTITKPTLLLDGKKCRDNIRMMSSKAQKHNIIFRPHFKTHLSLEIGRWFKEYGVDRITVSSFEMAEYFSDEWKDITVAFPVNILEIESINELANRINLNLLVESIESISFLKENLKAEAGYFVKIDMGSHRTGIDPLDTEKINKILEVTETNDLMKFKGFLGHAGHTYNCKTKSEIIDVHEQGLNIMSRIKEFYVDKFPDLILSIGDTPGCSLSENFSGIDEIRPGNFVFYDLMQFGIGSCTIDQVAVAVACPIVAIHADRNEIVVYGGGIHFSKERIRDDPGGIIYGRVAEKTDTGWGDIIPGMYVKSLSQEHGIVSAPDNEIKKYKIGDHLIILPVHSCMTANLMKSYQTLEGKWISGF